MTIVYQREGAHSHWAGSLPLRWVLLLTTGPELRRSTVIEQGQPPEGMSWISILFVPLPPLLWLCRPDHCTTHVGPSGGPSQ